MKSSIVIGSCIIIAALIFHEGAFPFMGKASSQSTNSSLSSSQRWEYKVLASVDLRLKQVTPTGVTSALSDPKLGDALAAALGHEPPLDIEAKFNELGAEGWELFVCQDKMFVFKRPTR